MSSAFPFKKVMRNAILLLVIASMALFAGACSSSNDSNSTAASEMRTVQTDKGEVEIPVNPQRIVSDYYLGEFLAVDVKPVIASPYALNNPYLDGLTDGIEPMNITSAETTLE